MLYEDIEIWLRILSFLDMRLWLHLAGKHPKEKGKHIFHATIYNSMLQNSIGDPFISRRGRNVERLNCTRASRLSLKLDRLPYWGWID